MIGLTALQGLIYVAVVAGALVPLILLVLFILDYKSKSIW